MADVENVEIIRPLATSFKCTLLTVSVVGLGPFVISLFDITRSPSRCLHEGRVPEYGCRVCGLMYSES